MKLVYLVCVGLVSVNFNPSVHGADIIREAESADSIISPLKVFSKSSASGGKYLSSSKKDRGEAVFNFSIPAAGAYILSARVKASSDSKNSFYISVNGGSKQTWHLQASNSYQWRQFGNQFNLSVGSNQIRIHVREAYTELDVIKLSFADEVSNDPSITPTPIACPSMIPCAVPTPAPGCTIKVVSPAKNDSNNCKVSCAQYEMVCVTPTPVVTITPKPVVTTPPTPTPVSNPGSNLDPRLAPGQNFNLTLWKLTLPVDKSGGFSGGAMEVKPIAATYQTSPYFYTESDGAMTFMAPTEGATTTGSHYPRSELREMTSSGTNAAWTVEQGGSLSATMSVNELPQYSAGNGRVVIGQIHGPDDELCRLYYDNGKLYFYDDKAGAKHTEIQYVLKSSTGATTSIPLDEKFDYSILVANGFLTVTAVHNGVTYSAADPISSFWPGKALYFKAGIYVQIGKPGSGAGTTGSGRGRVSFYKLSKPTHP